MKKILTLATLSTLLISCFLLFYPIKSSTSSPLDANYYYLVRITGASGIPSNASGYVRVIDGSGRTFSVPYQYGKTTYTIDGVWTPPSVVAIPELDLNVSVPMKVNTYVTFTNPINHCIGSLTLEVIVNPIE